MQRYCLVLLDMQKGPVLPSPPNPGTHIPGYGYDQSKKSSTIGIGIRVYILFFFRNSWHVILWAFYCKNKLIEFLMSLKSLNFAVLLFYSFRSEET